ncbi:MAG: tetratricopeptide repeat protein [Kofleriaceae bacterium]
MMIRQVLATLLLCLPITAGAEDVDKQLAAYENEARIIGTDLPRPNQLTGAQGQRRLVDAEVAFSLGDYDTAALMLFDIASRPGGDQETALFYLAESLYQKGDKGAARNYFEQVVASNNQAGRYYQASLIRLVEIAIVQKDSTNIDAHLASLDRVANRTSEVPYVRGKYLFSEGKFDEALTFFAQVPKGDEHELQAAYYSGASHVAKKDLGRATEIYTDLIGRKPRTNSDRRVIELSQLALGRLYYERDQPSKSIDSYLLVDRRSDLFADALYEVAWVYVKGKQYDKALRALELLHLSDPTSTKTPTVRILEGNLRIRKAQIIRQAQITGTLDANLRNIEPSVEYDKAAAVFTETHDAYLPSYQALEQMSASNTDPAQYLAQLAGRSAGVFQSTAPLPEAAAQYLRDEPEVQRIVSVEVDLGEVETNIQQSESIIARLEGVLAAGDRTAVYPALSSRRSRIGMIQDDLIKIRSDLADQQLLLVDSSGGIASATATRKQLFAQYTAMPNAETAYAERVASVHAQYDTVEQGTADVSAVIDSTQAVAVALRKYSNDAQPAIAPAEKTSILETLDQTAKEAQAIEAELAETQREILLGRDLAGVGDDSVIRAREARKALKAALDAEHRALGSAVSASRDKNKSQRLAGLGDRATRLSDNLGQVESSIDSIVDRGMEQVKQAIVTERQNLVAYRTELAEYGGESRAIGGTVLGASFKDVKAKFYDIIIRTDVGNVDVGWSQKEDADDDLKRLNLSRTRELRQLQDEFRDVLEGGKKLEPEQKPESSLPAADPNAPGGSPDRATGTDSRVKPGGDKPIDKTPTVKPDATGPAPKKGAQPKKAAPKGSP